jgi:hypothetical protein
MFVGIAQIAALQGRHEPPARLLGAVAAQRESLGMALSSIEQAAEERARNAARDALGDKAFAAAMTKGAAMETEAALQCARKV